MTTLVLSVLSGSSSFLYTIRTTIKAVWVRISSRSYHLFWSKLPLSILNIDGYCCDCSSLYIFDWIFFILSSIKGKHKSLDEFEIMQDPTKDLLVSCPWAPQKIPIDL